MMPDKGGGVKAQIVAGFEDPPAEVHVISCGAEDRIEAADFCKDIAPNRKITSREVLCFGIRQENMRRTSRSGCDQRRLRRRRHRWNIRPSRTANRITGGKLMRDPPQPVRLHNTVVIRVNKDVARRLLRPDVARRAQAEMRNCDFPNPPIARHQFRNPLITPVVHEQQLKIRVVQIGKGIETFHQGRAAPVGADNDRHFRCRLERQFIRAALQGRPLRLESRHRRLRGLIPTPHSEAVLLDRIPPALPEVGPGKHRRPRRPRATGFLDVPVQHFRLLLFPVSAGIDAEFGNQKRLIAREILEPSQVGGETFAIFEIQIEGHKVLIPREQILGARIIRVSEKRARVVRMTEIDETFKLLEDLPFSHPADQGRLDLVPDKIPSQRGMPAEPVDRLQEQLIRPGEHPGFFREVNMLRPRQRDKDPQAIAGALMHEEERRNLVDPNRIRSEFLTNRPQLADSLIRKRAGRKRAEGHAFQEDNLIARTEKFSANTKRIINRRNRIVEGRHKRGLGPSPNRVRSETQQGMDDHATGFRRIITGLPSLFLPRALFRGPCRTRGWIKRGNRIRIKPPS